MDDYYTLKEIILGLRKEQLRIANKLYDLKKYINTCGKNYQDSRLELNGIYQLEYCYSKKIHCFENLLNLLLCDSEAKYFDYNITNVLKIGEGKIYFTDNIFINDEYQEIFMKKFNSLIDDKFLRIMMFDNRNKHNNIENQHLSFSHNSIFCYKNYNGLRGIKSNILDYNPYTDMINICLYYRYQNIKEHINELLNLKFPKRLFSECIQEIIEKSEETKKDIFVPDVKTNSIKINFFINDEYDSLILRKKHR